MLTSSKSSFELCSCLPQTGLQQCIQVQSENAMNLLSSLLSNNKEEEEEKAEEKERSFDFFFCFHAKDYFNIEEEVIFRRIKSAVLLTPSFELVLDNQPDLYGPLWISTTLIVIIIAASSLMHFFQDVQTAYDFNKLTMAASLIYGIAFGSPYIIAIMIKVFGGLASVVDLMCIYGYSLTCFLPVTCLCFIDSWVIQTAMLGVAFLCSTIFLVRGILNLGDELGQKEKGILSLFIVGVQLLMVAMYKFYFFNL